MHKKFDSCNISIMTEKTNAKAIDFLLHLGSVEQIQNISTARTAGRRDFHFNSHIHLPPNFSAFETVEQALTLCARQDVKVIGIGNYYDFTVYDDVSEIARQKGIFPLFCTEIIALERDLAEKGIHVNDGGNPGKYYICGKGITKFERLTSRARELLNRVRTNDAERMRQMTGKLSQLFSDNGVETFLDDKAIIEQVVRRHGCSGSAVTLQERHVAQAFQEVFFEKIAPAHRIAKLSQLFGFAPISKQDDVVGIQNEIRSFLMKAGKACYVDETFISLAEAKELIGQLGGISCYPILADGTDRLCEYEYPLEEFVATLRENNFSMVEFITVRNTPEVMLEYAKAVRRAGIVVTAGTEHNTLDILPIKPLCVQGKGMPKELEEMFWEGICVIAAHQYLCANGRCGFVDSHGILNPDYSDSEQRIESFRKLGAKVIEKYFDVFYGT